MKNVIGLLKNRSLTILGIAALGMGTLFITPLKFILFYQPECPRELNK